MKIVLVSPFSTQANNIAGGVAAVTHYLAYALIEVGHEVIVLAPGKVFGEKERRGKLDILWFGNTLLPGFLVYANQQRKQIFSLLEGLQPDVVHFEGVFGWSINCAFPYVVTIHGIAERDAAFSGNIVKRIVSSNIIKMMENKGRKLAKQVISISPYATAILKEKLTGQIHHINNPIDPSLFECDASANANREDKLVCVGVIGERKNTLGVIERFSKLKQYYPLVKLVVCGTATSDSYLQECRLLANKLGLADDINFVGNLSRTELYSELATAKGLLMMSRQETAPMAIAEAMAAGVPCLAPKEFGIPYMIDEGLNGWFISDNTTEEKWIQMTDILKSDALPALSEHCKQSALLYHPQKIAKDTVTVYQLAINNFG
jgi:glycosyltransferase involved in cell wall biosynthesis